MPRAPAYLCEHAIFLLYRDMRNADVAEAINCNAHNVRSIKQCYRETGRTADHPCSGKPVTVCPPKHAREFASALVEEWGNISQQELANLVQSMTMRSTVVFICFNQTSCHRCIKSST